METLTSAEDYLTPAGDYFTLEGDYVIAAGLSYSSMIILLKRDYFCWAALIFAGRHFLDFLLFL